MNEAKRELIDFMLRAGVLTFGDFVTKSGRNTPFFVNTGRYRTGAQLRQLGAFYARAIVERFDKGFDVLFGPAYKGIPLATATAIALAENHGIDVPFCFNRKEAKDHGEGGLLVGEKLTDGQRVLIIEDVTTAGTSVHETVPILRAAARIDLAGLVVSVDRMERGSGELNALPELAATYSMPTLALVTIDEIAESLRGREIDGRVVLDDATYARLREYRREYGGREG